MQETIVYIILAVTAAAVIRHFYRQFSGKSDTCACDASSPACAQCQLKAKCKSARKAVK